MSTATSSTLDDNSPAPQAASAVADCDNCRLVVARVVKEANRFFESGLYCPLCDAGPLPPAAH